MGKDLCAMKIHGTVTVGPKGQVVIPKEVRDIFNISPLDSLVIITKGDKAIAMVKNENITELFEYAKSEGISLEK